MTPAPRKIAENATSNWTAMKPPDDRPETEVWLISALKGESFANWALAAEKTVERAKRPMAPKDAKAALNEDEDMVESSRSMSARAGLPRTVRCMMSKHQAAARATRQRDARCSSGKISL